MDRDTLIAAIDFGRERLLGTLDAIEKSGQDVNKVLAWRPGPGRAHIAWQLMHCAATHDKYVNVFLRSGKVKDEQLIATYGGGSTPSDQNVPSLATIRQTLETHLLGFREFVQSVAPADFSKKIMAGSKERSIGEAVVLLTWHEAHHQGQIHLTWNLYKAAHGVR